MVNNLLFSTRLFNYTIQIRMKFFGHSGVYLDLDPNMENLFLIRGEGYAADSEYANKSVRIFEHTLFES